MAASRSGAGSRSFPGCDPTTSRGSCGSSIHAPAFGRRSSSPAGRAASPSAPAAGSSRPRGPETARIWDTLPGRFGRALPVLRGHAGGISDVEFAPDGETVLTASDDGSARLWRAATGEQLAVFRSPTAPTRALFSPSGKRIVTTRRGEVRVWAVDAVPAQFARRLPPMFESPPIGAITFTRDGSHLVAVVGRRVDARSRLGPDPTRVLSARSYRGRSSRSVPTAGSSRTSRGVQEVVTGNWRWRAQLSSATFSRDSARLAFAGHNGRVGVWTTGQATSASSAAIPRLTDRRLHTRRCRGRDQQQRRR